MRCGHTTKCSQPQLLAYARSRWFLFMLQCQQCLLQCPPFFPLPPKPPAVDGRSYRLYQEGVDALNRFSLVYSEGGRCKALFHKPPTTVQLLTNRSSTRHLTNVSGTTATTLTVLTISASLALTLLLLVVIYRYRFAPSHHMIDIDRCMCKINRVVSQ